MPESLDIAIIGDISAEDDYLHPVQAAPDFCETNLFYYAGKTTTDKILGGIIRVANRPNLGYAEGTVLYFPGDGSALFKYDRPEKSDNSSWRVSDWDIDVVTPGGVEFSSSFNGSALHLQDPKLLETPKLAFQQPSVDLKLELSHFGKSPVVEFMYKGDTKAPDMKSIASTKGLHQLTAVTGAVALGDQTAERLSGYGWRDHNWGPRNWQAFPRHAFYTGNFGVERGFVLFKSDGGSGYFMHEGPGKIDAVTALDMKTEYKGDDREPASMRADLTLESGDTHVIEGQQLCYIPLRNRRDNLTTHLGYSLWHDQLNGQQEGYSIAEHLSQSMAGSETV